MQFTNKHITNTNSQFTNSKGDLYASPITSTVKSMCDQMCIAHAGGHSQSENNFQNPVERSETGQLQTNTYRSNLFLSEQERLVTHNSLLITFLKRRNTMEHPEVLPGGRNARKATNTKSTNNKFSKRSNTMKYNRFITIAATIFVALMIVVSGTFAQGNAALSGTVTNNGTIKVRGTLSGATTTIGGTVEFNAAGVQSIPGGYTFTNLTASGGTGAKTLGGATAVSGTLTVNNAGLNLVLGGSTLTYSGTGAMVATSGTFDFSSGTVVYSADATQTVFGTTYANLTTSGATVARTKSAGGAVTVTGTLTNGANTTLDFAANTFTGTGATFANSATLKSSSTVTVTAAAAINGTFEYASGGAQTIAPASYTNLTISGAGTKTFTNGATYSIAGTYTPGGVASVYTGSTIVYNGAAALQTIADVDYANLTFSTNTKAWTLTGTRSITSLTLNAGTATTIGGAFDLNVSGNIALSSNLTKSNNAIVFANAASTVTGALNEIIGTVTRTHVFVAATAYQFNNQYTTVALSVPPVAQNFSMTVSPGTNPTGYLVNHSVNRTFVPAFTSLGTGTADVQLAYLSGEIGTLTENKLKEFNNGIASGNKMAGGAYTRTAVGGTFGYVRLAAITTAFASGQQLALDDRFNVYTTVNLVAADWNTGSTWDAGSAPSSTDDAIVNTTGVTLAAAGSANNLTINSGRDLTLTTAASALTIGGGLTNSGTLTVSNAAGTVTVTGTLTNNGTGTLSNAGTITVQ
jgi:fibronectin-binding autotransporter adhesin